MRIGIDATALQVRRGRHGTGAYLRGLLGALGARRPPHELCLFSYGPSAGDLGVPTDAFRIVKLPAPALGRAQATVSHQLALPLAARRLGVRALHIPGVSVNASMPSIPLWQPVPVVVTVHDLSPLRFPDTILPRPRHRIFYRAMLGAVRRAAHLLCDSEATRDDLIARTRMSAGRITVARLAAEPLFTSVPGPSGDERAAALEDEGYVLHVGGAGATKNLPRLLRAMVALWGETAMPVALACVTDRPFDPIALCPEAAPYRSRIHVLGDTSPQFLLWLYQHARCLAFPSLHEGFGLPVLEAMASGCPVITSRVASLPEVAGEAAVYVEPRDVESIRDALAEVVGDGARRRALRAAGLERARRFDYATTAELTLGVYEAVGGSRARGSR